MPSPDLENIVRDENFKADKRKVVISAPLQNPFVPDADLDFIPQSANAILPLDAPPKFYTDLNEEIKLLIYKRLEEYFGVNEVSM